MSQKQQQQNEQPPILIDEDAPVEGGKVTKRPKNKRKVKWNRFIEFDFKKPREKIRFGVTYLISGLGLIFVSDVFQLIKLNTTAGFMVAIGVILIVAAIIVPVIILLSEQDL